MQQVYRKVYSDTVGMLLKCCLLPTPPFSRVLNQQLLSSYKRGQLLQPACAATGSKQDQPSGCAP